MKTNLRIDHHLLAVESEHPILSMTKKTNVRYVAAARAAERPPTAGREASGPSSRNGRSHARPAWVLACRVLGGQLPLDLLPRPRAERAILESTSSSARLAQGAGCSHSRSQRASAAY